MCLYTISKVASQTQLFSVVTKRRAHDYMKYVVPHTLVWKIGFCHVSDKCSFLCVCVLESKGDKFERGNDKVSQQRHKMNLECNEVF